MADPLELYPALKWEIIRAARATREEMQALHQRVTALEESSIRMQAAIWSLQPTQAEPHQGHHLLLRQNTDTFPADEFWTGSNHFQNDELIDQSMNSRVDLLGNAPHIPPFYCAVDRECAPSEHATPQRDGNSATSFPLPQIFDYPTSLDFDYPSRLGFDHASTLAFDGPSYPSTLACGDHPSIVYPQPRLFLRTPSREDINSRGTDQARRAVSPSKSGADVTPTKRGRGRPRKNPDSLAHRTPKKTNPCASVKLRTATSATTRSLRSTDPPPRVQEQRAGYQLGHWFYFTDVPTWQDNPVCSV
ncbi:hypothetical protein DFH06DRAFT_51380 [Mycena polygramma]|nr:hypothetical protein DFH06DRAFT_51380 [Mycena polygramma]